MALVIQNDSGTQAGANSYGTIAEFKTYWTDRGVDYTATADADITSWLIPANSYLDTRFVWEGYKLNGRDQTTQFPRGELYDCSGEYDILVSGVPREAKEAQFEYAHIYATTDILQPNGSTDGNVTLMRNKVGPLEEEYEYSPAGQSGDVVAYPQADNKIPECFIAPGFGSGMGVHV